MGLIHAAVGAAGGTLADTWRDYFYCDSLDEGTLAAKGEKRVSDTGRSSNYKGEDNIISNGSIIAVNDGQCAIIVQQGAVKEICAEPGQFVFNDESEPSLMYGSLGHSIGRTFHEMGKRIGFGGDTGMDQRVYYFNTKEMFGNKFGTTTPIPFRIVDRNIGLDLDTAVRCNGRYSYKLEDPLLFYANVCGNVEEPFTYDRIEDQMRSELLLAMQPALAQISDLGIRYNQVPAHARELTGFLSKELSGEWTDKRGISIVSCALNSVTLVPEDEERIKKLQETAVLRDPTMAAASLTNAQSDAMRSAAANENGAWMGFMGMGMAQQAGGMDAQRLYQMGGPRPDAGTPQAATGAGAGTSAGERQQAAAGAGAQGQAPAGGTGEWTCPGCGATVSSKFCPACGTKRPESETPAEWFCPECGAKNAGKFCGECGCPKPGR